MNTKVSKKTKQNEAILYYAEQKEKQTNELLKEMLEMQIKNVNSEDELSYEEMKRICKYINKSIFGDECSLWQGYITNMNKSHKGTYINFHFRGEKTALHRLLYKNFRGPLSNDDYVKYKCENKGMCCNVNHYKKYRYTNKKKKEPKYEIKLFTEDTVILHFE
jgi:hypothetical protein